MGFWTSAAVVLGGLALGALAFAMVALARAAGRDSDAPGEREPDGTAPPPFTRCPVCSGAAMRGTAAGWVCDHCDREK
jgi:hypothetical protein